MPCSITFLRFVTPYGIGIKAVCPCGWSAFGCGCDQCVRRGASAGDNLVQRCADHLGQAVELVRVS